MSSQNRIKQSAVHIILIGFASCGKSTVGRILANLLQRPFVDLDKEIEKLYESRYEKKRSCREIFARDGERQFAVLESEALTQLTPHQPMVLATGGGAPVREKNDQLLSAMGAIIYLEADPEIILQRMSRKGLPAFLRDDPSVEGIRKVIQQREQVYTRIADVQIETTPLTPDQTVQAIIDALERNNYFKQKGL